MDNNDNITSGLHIDFVSQRAWLGGKEVPLGSLLISVDPSVKDLTIRDHKLSDEELRAATREE